VTIFRKAAGALAACLLAATAATAGDFSTFQSLGFSPDGKVYAFEEFGVQDGSGFPYSNVYFIDTAKDAYLSGTPIRVRIDDEAADIATVRAQSRDKAKALIEAHKVLSNPGVLAAFNPMGEVGADRNRIEYLQYAVEPTPGGSFALALQEIPLALSDKCRDITPDGGKGFRLKLVKRDGETADTVVHEDTRIPDSRACPLSYQVSGALTFNPLDGDPVHVALVLVRSFGFEGADGRWIAVPFRP
jgi:predicted secreted protein